MPALQPERDEGHSIATPQASSCDLQAIFALHRILTLQAMAVWQIILGGQVNDGMHWMLPEQKILGLHVASP
jgi:hypothetical protein